MFDMKDKVVIITGSSRGIGRASAEQLARAGAKVVVSSRKAEACSEVASTISDAGGIALVVPCHVGERSQIENLVSATMDAFGRIDGLVCNAATNPTMGPLSTLTDDVFTKIMQVNVQSTLWLSNLCAPIMAKQGGGSIVLLSSITAILGNAFIGAYGMSKAAEGQLARNLAVELGPENIRVNSIAPGLVKTDFAKAIWDNPELMKKQLGGTPLGRIGQPTDIAGIVHFLLSEAANYITGQMIVADGGETII
ncbi:MAG: SDR family NAD(P)-dependent oxidoreductase [Alphaproteobacteria bacterium]